MNINTSITDVQQAKRIIEEVGEVYQSRVLDNLMYLTCKKSEYTDEQKAIQVISNIYDEYALNNANVLWRDKFEEIPQYLKQW
ncbi:hypothetical protein [Clostridium botulinum]|uniref:hypothetical protein n=1 Tax=Clostridium botulinum TaxID=1491 RepID=UPI001C9B2A20|nr:hypothetical protein [Clostridium botulinum]MBY6838703.1 hypothetical protein [Clostridium botulinum]